MSSVLVISQLSNTLLILFMECLLRLGSAVTDYQKSFDLNKVDALLLGGI